MVNCRWIYPDSVVAIFAIFAFTQLGCQGPAGPDGDDAVLADSLAPVLTWLTPEPGLVIDNGTTLSAQVSDDQGISQMVFYIAGFEFPGILTDTLTGIYSYEWSARLWPEGPYPLMARAWDSARNSATAPVVIVRVEHP